MGPSEYDPYPRAHPECPITLVNVQVDKSPVVGGGEARAGLHHVTSFTGVWDIHVDVGFVRGQLYAPSRLPMLRPIRHFLADLDGRADFATLGTPGGDMGEFVLALASLERARGGRPLSRADVHALFAGYLAVLERQAATQHRSLYMGTDRAAVRVLAMRSGVADPLHPRSRAEAAAVLPHVAATECVGSVHLHALLDHPEEYGVRARLTATVISAFYRGLLMGRAQDATPGARILASHLTVGVMDGYHEEQGLLRVFTMTEAAGCRPLAPLVVPRLPSGKQFAVLHPQAVQGQRAHLAAYMEGQAGSQLRGREGEVLRTMRALGEQQLDSTLQRLLGDSKPRLSVVFTDTMGNAA